MSSFCNGEGRGDVLLCEDVGTVQVGELNSIKLHRIGTHSVGRRDHNDIIVSVRRDGVLCVRRHVGQLTVCGIVVRCGNGLRRVAGGKALDGEILRDRHSPTNTEAAIGLGHAGRFDANDDLLRFGALGIRSLRLCGHVSAGSMGLNGEADAHRKCKRECEECRQHPL